MASPARDDSPIVDLDRVTKAFRGRTALDGVSLAIGRGEIVGVLGDNGAGKTTLLGLMLGLLRPSAGEIRVRGIATGDDGLGTRTGIGSVVSPAFYEHLSGWENLVGLAGYSGPVAAADVAEAARFVGLTDRIHDRTGTYSHGMRRRLALAQALLPPPDLVLLDEPEEGLDAAGMLAVRALIVRMNRERGVTIVLATHQLGAVAAMCTRVVVLERGRLVFDGTPAALASAGGDDIERGYLSVLAAARSAARARDADTARTAAPRSVAAVPPAAASSNAFVRGLRWELAKLWRRPRTYAGFAVCLLFDVTLAALIQLPAVREVMARRFWKTKIDVDQALTGLTVATHLLAETAALIGALFVCFVTCDIVGREFEDGTIRMVLSRPVGRTSVWLQKLMAAVAFTAAFTLFIGATALAVGLVAEGATGKLHLYEPRESLLAILPFQTGLARYGAAVAFLVVSMQMITALAFALACFPIKPATAAVLAFAFLLADNLVRFDPGLVAVSPYTVSTRFLTWRQVFNEDVQWLRVQRNYGFQLRFDLALLVIGWWVFRRRDVRS